MVILTRKVWEEEEQEQVEWEEEEKEVEEEMRSRGRRGARGEEEIQQRGGDSTSVECS